GRENLEAISFLQQLNHEMYSIFPDVTMIAEESTAWPGVTKPTYDGGLGFLYKWNMGWMHDTLEFFREDPVHRGHHYREFTFPLMYAYSEHYVLSFSHDEAVHGKGSMFGKMPGGPTNSDWQKASNLRLMYGHMFGHPGKKLLFMGSEFGQGREWSHDRGIDWWLLDKAGHRGLKEWVRELNALYARHACLHCEADGGFEWIDFSDTIATTASYQRIIPEYAADRLPEGVDPSDRLMFVFNFTPVGRISYPVGAPAAGCWEIVLNSDETRFGGSGTGSSDTLETRPEPLHGREQRLELDLPPLGLLILREAG
ncbi:MAG: 1,4-alpha-glucan branching enzyme, partial [Rhodothermales bacterium]|nr:1,4-alpha-glucan branching enzyme [Rhodothermales bacterium]